MVEWRNCSRFMKSYDLVFELEYANQELFVVVMFKRLGKNRNNCLNEMREDIATGLVVAED
ncbi:hypothetical protein C5167_003996 [Papaver somniferum]|nr:hypothetical protein C5167_003996 [Papaver somniferum]